MNPLTRLAHGLGRFPLVMRLAPVIVAVDRVLHRISRGRLSLLRIAGMPSLRLVTTGRRTGQPRAIDLLYTPYGADYVVIGSGWGRPKHPAWSLNLMADPKATVILRGRAVPVVARRPDEREEADIWALAVRNWPGYEMELRIAGGREFRIFVLSATDA